jgi:hypothetical protein
MAPTLRLALGRDDMSPFYLRRTQKTRQPVSRASAAGGALR